MKKFILITCIIFSTASIFAQTKKPIFDETEEKETKSTYSIKTSVEGLYTFILKAFPKDYRRVTIVRKKDRIGEYFEYTVSFPLANKEQVQNQITKNFK